jgi:hypothetical protein
MSCCCLVCLCESGVTRCSEFGCHTGVCTDCLQRYVDMCLKDDMIPRCISPECNGMYYRSVCHGFEEVYDLALYRGLLKDPALHDATRAKEARRILLRHVIDERRRFLTTHFPHAIRRAVELLYDTELRKVEAAQRRVLESAAVVTRGCFRACCTGTMTVLPGGQWVCGLCESVFCATCEDRVGPGTHECTPDEAASVEWKKALPQCPRCSQPIEKSSGCRFMTCAVCQQNFDYTTGVPSAAGNHGASVPVVLKRHDGIARLYEILLKGRSPGDLTASELDRYTRLQEIEKIYDPKRPPVQWSAAQVLPKSMRNEAAQAKLVATRVERLEVGRQESRRLIAALRDLEDEILAAG